MAFTPRLTPPDINDKYWVSTACGGLSPCIRPVGAATVLPNCFSSDTKFLTTYGTQTLKDCVGHIVTVPTIKGDWQTATVQYFGKSKLYRVTLTNGNSYKATPNHRWAIFNRNNNSHRVVTTDQLVVGMQIRYYDDLTAISGCTYVKSVACLSDKEEDVYCVVQKSTQTFALGGGEIVYNCVGWAFGRFYEILGTLPTLSRSDAKQWYPYTADGYARSRTPRLGSVVCWSSPTYGHVAIVEQINPDGSIVVSQSAYKDAYFDPSAYHHWWTQTLYPPNYAFYDYVLQGFIHNPGVSDADGKGPVIGSSGTTTSSNKHEFSTLAQAAEHHKGELGTWTWGKMNLVKGQAWNTAFINAIATEVDGASSVIPKASSPKDFPMKATASQGSWLDGPANKLITIPQVGDLMLIRDGVTVDSSKYASNRAGVVVKVDSNTVDVIEGDCGSVNPFRSTVRTVSYKVDSKSIVGYYRPNIKKSSSSSTSTSFAPIYTDTTTRQDSIVREVGYLDSGMKPSIQLTDTRLSAINYTPAVGSMFNTLADPNSSSSSSSSSSTTNTSSKSNSQSTSVLKLSSKEQTIVRFFAEHGYNTAVGVGVLANASKESSIQCGKNVKTSDGKYTGGLLMWPNDVFIVMKKYVGSNWANNLSGQLQFIEYDWNRDATARFASKLKSLYKEQGLLAAKMYSIPNTKAGALLAADIISRVYLSRTGEVAQQVQELATKFYESVATIIK